MRYSTADFGGGTVIWESSLRKCCSHNQTGQMENELNKADWKTLRPSASGRLEYVQTGPGELILVFSGILQAGW